MIQTPFTSGDFVRLRESGARPGAGLAIGRAVLRLRDGTALALAGTGVSPHLLSWAGLALAVGAGICLALGAGHSVWWVPAGAGPASWWPVAAAVLLLGSALMDMLDGALARAGRRDSRFGAVLDSSLDRLGDLAVYVGCAVYFARAANLTYVVLSIIAVGSAFMVSYVKARAESLGCPCNVGYWQRGERLVLFVAAAALGHVPAGLWLVGLGPVFTVARRMREARAGLSGRTPRVPSGWAGALAPWRSPRGSLAYDAWTVLLFVFLAAAPWAHPLFTAGADPLRGR